MLRSRVRPANHQEIGVTEICQSQFHDQMALCYVLNPLLLAAISPQDSLKEILDGFSEPPVARYMRDHRVDDPAFSIENAR